MKIFVVVCTVFLTLLNVYKSGGQESLPPNVLNIIVILDTSNRTRQEDQIQRDIRIVKAIVTEFEAIVHKHIDESNDLAYTDALAVVVPNQPIVPSPWEIVETLKIEMPKREDCDNCGNYEGLLRHLKQQKEALLNEMPRLYEFVEQHPQTGSDIYEWFKDDAEGYFDENKRNLIICLSDGYLNFDRRIEARRIQGTYMRVRELRDDPNWLQRIHDSEGLKPIEKDFSPYNVKFLMLEIVPQVDEDGIPYQRDFEIIRTYWDTWLNSMGIQDADFLKGGSGIPYRKIKSFISGEG